MKTGTEKNKSILLVDDIELFLELERTFFHREGFELLVAVEPQEIMQLVTRQQPDLVFIDMDAADVRGDEICRWMKRDEGLRLIPVIMVVEAGDGEAESLCRQAGCDAVIHRPVRRHQLLSAARTFLDLVDRQQSRVSTRVPVDFAISERQLKTHYTVNLSPGGLFVETDEELPVDTRLSLQVRFPSSGRGVTCQGRVAWTNSAKNGRKQTHLPAGMGIEFAQLDIEQLTLLKGFLAAGAA